MAQQHCQLPFLANLKQLDTLAQHLQGVLVHGQIIRMYRTYHNISNGTNLQIHTLLLTLELLLLKNNGKLPEAVYYQLDGGSENISKAMIGLSELIVAKGLTKRLLITRLPVGHTHEDIDSKFAKIWVALRNKHVSTSQSTKN